VFVWDGDLEKQIGRIPAGFNTNSVALTADGRRIATIGPNTVRVWDTDRLQLLLTITDDDLSVDLAFTRDGRLVAARSTGGLTVWNTQKPAVQTPLPPRVQHLRDPIRNIGPMRDQH
jgi:WD40 repeat protein